jgi:hypothetical protein
MNLFKWRCVIPIAEDSNIFTNYYINDNVHFRKQILWPTVSLTDYFSIRCKQWFLYVYTEVHQIHALLSL